MTMQSGTTPGTPTDRNGNGSIGAGTGLSASSGTPGTGPTTNPATMPDTSGMSGRGTGTERGWTRADESHRSEFGAFLDDLSELARGGGGQGSDLRNELERRVSQARERMSTALDQGREMTVRARDQMARGIDYSRDAVSERPLSYLGMAMIGGLLIGMLISRRD
jgi:ElaB/YqjD/DUF883 family membrane-anchored ribosome-binding protein